MIDPELARSIRLVGLDVDGVMTDGGIYLGAVNGAPLEFKRYDIQDGTGIALLRRTGILVAIVTGRVSESVRLRGLELGVDEVLQYDNGFKTQGFLDVLRRRGVALRETAFVGDDFPDLPILRLVGLPVAAGNAVAEIRQAATLQLSAPGGRGAVREFVELLLGARGEWDAAWGGYVAERTPAQGVP